MYKISKINTIPKKYTGIGPNFTAFATGIINGNIVPIAAIPIVAQVTIAVACCLINGRPGSLSA